MRQLAREPDYCRYDDTGVPVPQLCILLSSCLQTDPQCQGCHSGPPVCRDQLEPSARGKISREISKITNSIYDKRCPHNGGSYR